MGEEGGGRDGGESTDGEDDGGIGGDEESWVGESDEWGEVEAVVG